MSSGSSSAACLPCHAGLGQTLPETAVVRKKLRQFSIHGVTAADFNGRFSIEIFLKSYQNYI